MKGPSAFLHDTGNLCISSVVLSGSFAQSTGVEIWR